MAAADCVDREGNPPAELAAAWRVARFPHLADYLIGDNEGTITRCIAYSNVYDYFSAYIAAKNKAEWARLNPTAWSVVSMIEYERYKAKAK
jgi:hypothetical protein